MAASQARLLSITARLSNNELEQQSVAYSKQRLADNSEQINDEYLEALNKTKYQILTGYNNSQATYADLTYAAITGNNTVASGKQYVVKVKDGKILVSQQIADAFTQNNGDYNRFLANLGYKQSNIDVSKISEAKEAVHEAWDRYLVSVGKGIYDVNGNTEGSTGVDYEGQHILNFGYTSFSQDAFDGYPTYESAFYQDAEGNKVPLYKDSQGYYRERYSVEARYDVNNEIVVCYQTEDQKGTDAYHELKDVTFNTETQEFTYTNMEGETVITKTLYADPKDNTISENIKNYFEFDAAEDKYKSEGGQSVDITKQSKALNYEGTTVAQRELYDYAVAITAAFYEASETTQYSNLKYDAQTLTYYKNIFNEMRTHGYTTLAEAYKHKLSTTTDSAAPGLTGEGKIFNDPDWMVKQLKAGNLTISYYSIAEKGFIKTTLDDDESITEREDSAKMAIAEQVYKKRMDQVQAQDKQFDLQLNKLESEHNALQTEYEAVKNVIKNNVEKSFNTFNA
jgi:hypothetical protein